MKFSEVVVCSCAGSAGAGSVGAGSVGTGSVVAGTIDAGSTGVSYNVQQEACLSFKQIVVIINHVPLETRAGLREKKSSSEPGISL